MQTRINTFFVLKELSMNYLYSTLVMIGTNLSRWAPFPNDIRFNKVR
jgi:hypothetical protein